MGGASSKADGSSELKASALDSQGPSNPRCDSTNYQVSSAALCTCWIQFDLSTGRSGLPKHNPRLLCWNNKAWMQNNSEEDREGKFHGGLTSPQACYCLLSSWILTNLEGILTPHFTGKTGAQKWKKRKKVKQGRVGAEPRPNSCLLISPKIVFFLITHASSQRKKRKKPYKLYHWTGQALNFLLMNSVSALRCTGPLNKPRHWFVESQWKQQMLCPPRTTQQASNPWDLLSPCTLFYPWAPGDLKTQLTLEGVARN